MPTQNNTTFTFEAGQDLSSYQYRFVVLATDGQVDYVASAGGDADGVLMNDPSAAGDAAEVAVLGIAKIEVGAGGVTCADKLQSDATGKALTAASGDHVLARALSDGDAGDIIPCLLISHHILA